MRYCSLRYLYIFLIFIVLLGSWHHTASAQFVDFPDENLDKAVRDNLMNIPPGDPIPLTRVQGIMTLAINNALGITNLEGLQHATSLTTIALSKATIDNPMPIRNFTPISSLINLKNLSLRNVGFSNSDISKLSPLVNLTDLTLSQNRISDLQALVNVISANIPNLGVLSVDYNRFCDITSFTAFKNQLTSLALNGNQITDFGPLAAFTNLEELYLERTGIRDLRVLSGLTSLTRLDLSSNGISNLEHLSNLTNLTRLFLDRNQVTDLQPLSDLTNLTHLLLDRNQVTDLQPLSDLTNLTLVWACWNAFPDDPNLFESLRGLTAMEDFSVDTTYETQARAVFPTTALHFFCNPARASSPLGALQDFCSTSSETTLNPESESELGVKRRRRIITQCGLGWAPHSQSHLQVELPKVMIYALEFEYDPESHGTYTCKTIEIRTGDDTIESLAGWKLYLGTLYNPSRVPLTIPEAHSQVRDRILRITPEMLGLEAFPCNTVNGISHPLPGVQYVLKTDENILVDTAYSCFIWGQTAYTTVNGENVESPRRISSAALRGMETPRLERYIWDNTGVYITYMSLDEFTWDRVVLSDWLLPTSEVSAPGAPSAIQRKLVTTWGALKKK